MAHHASAKKQYRQSLKHKARNRRTSRSSRATSRSSAPPSQRATPTAAKKLLLRDRGPDRQGREEGRHPRQRRRPVQEPPHPPGQRPGRGEGLDPAPGRRPRLPHASAIARRQRHLGRHAGLHPPVGRAQGAQGPFQVRLGPAPRRLQHVADLEGQACRALRPSRRGWRRRCLQRLAPPGPAAARGAAWPGRAGPPPLPRGGLVSSSRLAAACRAAKASPSL